MNGKMTLLSELHQARLDRLREICSQHNISKTGSVEVLRAKLISELVLDEWDFSPNGIDTILNNDLGRLLAVFGVKKSGSIRERRQRLYLHLNYDAKQLTPEVAERAVVLANLKKQIATAKVNAQRAATIKAQEKAEEAAE